MAQTIDSRSVEYYLSANNLTLEQVYTDAAARQRLCSALGLSAAALDSALHRALNDGMNAARRLDSRQNTPLLETRGNKSTGPTASEALGTLCKDCTGSASELQGAIAQFVKTHAGVDGIFEHELGALDVRATPDRLAKAAVLLHEAAGRVPEELASCVYAAADQLQLLSGLQRARLHADAVDKHYRDVQANPRNARALYGLGANLAQLREYQGPGEVTPTAPVDTSKHTICDYLGKALEMTPRSKRPDLIAQMQADPHLAPVRDTLFFQMQVAGADPKKPEGARQLLENVTWRLQASADATAAPSLTFVDIGGEGGAQAELKYTGADGQPHVAAGEYALKQVNGRTQIEIKLAPEAAQVLGGASAFTATLEADGTLKLDDKCCFRD